MAEDQEIEQSVTDALTEDDAGSGGGLGKILRILLPVGILVLAAAAGHFASRLGGSDGAPAKAAAEEEQKPPPPPRKDEDFTYVEMEPIVVNPNVPRLERYIRVALTLAIRKEDYGEASKIIKKKMPELKNSVILYLADCSLDEVRGTKNLNRILREIQDSFNERLWPDQRPMIVKVGYKEWLVQ